MNDFVGNCDCYDLTISPHFLSETVEITSNMRFRQILTENLLFWRLEKEPKKFSFVALLEPNVTPPGFNIVLNMDTSEANMALNMDTSIPNMALPKRYTKESCYPILLVGMNIFCTFAKVMTITVITNTILGYEVLR